jgi:hypothetical protein
MLKTDAKAGLYRTILHVSKNLFKDRVAKGPRHVPVHYTVFTMY